MITRADRNTQIEPGSLEHRVEARETSDSPSLTISRLAAYWGVHPDTIRRDIRKGALPAFRLPGGTIRIRMSDARRYGRPIE
jgi:excisionase family DNA binding protein